MDTFGLPHEVALLDFLEQHNALLVLNAGMNQYRLAAAFLAQWLRHCWTDGSNPVIICFGIHTAEETLALQAATELFPVIAARGGVNWLGQESSGRERRRLLHRGGVFTASLQTWVIDLLQIRVLGANVNGLIALNAETIPKHSNARFACQLLFASCGSPIVPYFVKAFVAEPTLLTTSMISMERTVSLLGLNGLHEDLKIVFCPKFAPKIAKYVDPLVATHIRTSQVCLKMTPRMLIIHDSFRTLRTKAVNQVFTNQDEAALIDLDDSLRNDSAASFLSKILFARYVAETNTDGDYAWHRTPEAALCFNAAIDRLASYDEVSLEELSPRLSALMKEVEGIPRPGPNTRVLVCFADIALAAAFGQTLVSGIDQAVLDEICMVALKSQEKVWFLPSERDVLADLHAKLGEKKSAINAPQLGEPCRVAGELVYKMSYREAAVWIAVASDVSDVILAFRPTHVLLTHFSVAWLRQLQYTVARMHACIDWAFDRTDPSIKGEGISTPPPNASGDAAEHGRRFVNARIPYSEISSEPNLDQPLPRIKLEPVAFIDLARTDADLKSAFAEAFANKAAAHQWVSLAPVQAVLCGFECEITAFKQLLVDEKTAWQTLAVQRGGLFVMQRKSHAETYESLPSDADKIAYLLTLNAGESGIDLPAFSTRRGGGGVAAFISSLRSHVRMPELNSAEYIASGSSRRRRLENVALHELLRKSGREVVEAVRTLVLVDIREIRSGVPTALWQAGIKIIPMQLETADYILTSRIGVERKSVADLSQSLSSGRLLSQVQRLTALFELPALLVELPGERFTQTESKTGVTDPQMIPRLTYLTLGFPRLRLLWTAGSAFTPQLFKLLKRFQPNPTLSDGRVRTRIDKAPGTVYRSAACTQVPVAVDALTFLPDFSVAICDLVVSNFSRLRDFIMADEAKLREVLGQELGARTSRFISARIA